MKIFICGDGRTGKDTLADMAKKHGFTHESSSHIMMRVFLREELARNHGLVYPTEEECYADRVNHRVLWMKLIRQYNDTDPTRLSRLIFRNYDIYVGIRNREEFLASRDLADLAIWVEKLDCPTDPSNSILEEDCDLTVFNSGSLEDLEYKANRLFSKLSANRGLTNLHGPDMMPYKGDSSTGELWGEQYHDGGIIDDEGWGYDRDEGW